MFVLARALTWSALFVGFLLVFLPARLLAGSGLGGPALMGPAQLLGMLATALGALLATWCILSFVVLGKGTPAPFDPPRQLVIRGPYRFVRNPMYVGATLALGGAALVFQSGALAAYAAGFLLVMHAFVVLYEEPILRTRFGSAYEEYCRRVGRWWPRARGA